MSSKVLGKQYHKNEVIIRQGETGNCMYVIQEGRVEVVIEDSDSEIPVAFLKKGDFFGEMSLFEKESRSATVRSISENRILTIDRKNLIRRTLEDPTLMLRIVETMSRRIRDLNVEVVKLNDKLRELSSK